LPASYSLDRDQQVELALLGTNLDDIDVKVADREAFELASDGCIVLHRGGLQYAVPLGAAVQRRARQVRNASLEHEGNRSAALACVSKNATIIASLSTNSTVDLTTFGPAGKSAGRGAPLPLGSRL
jgi:hypothetical protein